MLTNYVGALTLANCTDSGIRNVGDADFKNTFSANNATPTSPGCQGLLNSYGFNMVEDTTGCSINGDTTGNITGQDPNLGPL